MTHNTMPGHPKLRAGLLLALLMGGCNQACGKPTWKAERCILQPGSELLPCYNGLICCYNGTRRAFCCPKDYWDPNTGNQNPSYLELLALDDIQKLTTMRTVEEESLKQRELVEPDPSRMELMSTDDIQKMTMMSIVENEYLQMPKLVKPDPFRMELMSTDDINKLSMMRTVEDESLQQPKQHWSYHFGRYHVMGGGALAVVLVVSIVLRTGCVCARVALLTAAIKPENPRTTYTRFSNPPSGSAKVATTTTSTAPAALGWRRQHLDAAELPELEKSQTTGNESANEASLSSTVEASNWLDRFDNRAIENCTNAMKIQHPPLE